MAAIEVKLVRGLSRCPANHRVIVAGLGLKKRDSTKLLPDNPQTLGMIAKVSHLVSVEEVAGDAPARPRRKPAES